MANDYISQVTLPNNFTYDIQDDGAVRKTGSTMTGALKFSGNDSRSLTWEDGTWWQRILTTDDSTTNTAVFTFQQTSNSGGTWTNLFTIKDNGTVIATEFSGSGAALTNLTPTNLTGVVSTTAHKFLKDTGAWAQVDGSDLTGTVAVAHGGTGVTTEDDIVAKYGIEYIIGTEGTAASSWIGTTQSPALYVGKAIAYKLSHTPSGSASLTLTFTNPTGNATSGAIAIYTNNTRVTTHYAKNAVIMLVYDGTYWRATDYWNSNSRDPGYGKITPGAASTAVTALTANTTQITAGTYNEALTITPGNKWISLAGSQGASNGGDIFYIGHALSEVTAGTSSPNSAQTPSFNNTFNIPTITVDAAGHVTAMGTTTVKIPQAPVITTYTFANGTTGSFTVTPSGGSAQTVSIGKPSTAGTADKATAANIANGTTANAIAYYTNTTGTFGTKATSSGALYATSNNGALTFGVLPIAQGGIGSATTSPNYVLAGPSSGSAAGAPSWRKLVAADIPNLNTSKLNAGTLGVARGGTGKDTWAAYSLPYASAANTLGELAANTTTTRKFLMMQGNGSAVESFGWNTVTKTDVGLSNVTNDAQVKASLGSAIGDMVYWSAASTPARLAIGTVGQILKVVKNSSNQLVPQWGAAPETYPSGGSAGQCLAKTSSGVDWSDGTKKTADTSTLYYVCGSSSDSTNYNGLIFNTNVYVSSNVLFGAAWNDYAEYRECTQVIEPGRCIVENGDGTLSLSTQRLQGGAEIVSDTFGFAIGKTAKCKTPIAVSGRVLAYINEPIEQIKIGSPVCSGPNGTVSQMTAFEARKYPWLIIGTISAIPQEEFWSEAKVSTKNRIWIRIR